MTAQISDIFRWRGRDYDLAGISEGELFDPLRFGLHPEGTCSACWRGYQAIYGLRATRLVLDSLYVSLREAGKPICGVQPRRPRDEFDLFDNFYEGLDDPLDYTGGLLLADGFIDDLYVHMGFHPAWKYQTVREMIFERGVLTGEYDRSDRMAEIRQRVLESKAQAKPSGGMARQEIAQFVERAFDRRYRR